MTPLPLRRGPLLPPDLLREPKEGRLRAALYLAVLVLVGGYDLLGRSIFHRDVTRFATIAGEMIRSGEWLVPTKFGETYANKPILYIWCVAAIAWAQGSADALATRLPSLLALVATGWATAVWGRARSGSVALGRLAGLVVVTTYSLHGLGRTGRPDMLSTAFATIAAVLVDRALLGKAGPRAWIGIGLALGGGFLAKGPVVLLVPAALVLLPRPSLSLRERTRRIRPLFAFLLALLVAAAWVGPAYARGGFEYVKRLVVDQVGERVRGEGNHQEAFWYYPAAAGLAWLPWTGLLLAVPAALLVERGRRALAPATHVVAALVALLVLSLVPTKEIRYAAILVPPLAVGLAQLVGRWGAAGADDDAPSRARIHLVLGGVVAMAAVAGLAALEVRFPATAVPLTPIGLVLLGTGAGAIRRGTSAVTSREVRGRITGLVVVLVACGLLAYWVVLGRRLGLHSSEAENRVVAAVLERDVPVLLVGSEGPDGIDPDDFVVGAPVVRFVKRPEALDPASVRGAVQVLALAEDRAAIEARLGAMHLVLERPRLDGRVLVVLSRGP